MVAVKNEGIILEKTSLEFENKGVFNPACIQADGVTHMFYRAINRSDISSIGYCQLKGNKVIKRLERPVLFPGYDWEKMGVEDPRITKIYADISTIGIIFLSISDTNQHNPYAAIVKNAGKE